jgi:hypothetical protein
MLGPADHAPTAPSPTIKRTIASSTAPRGTPAARDNGVATPSKSTANKHPAKTIRTTWGITHKKNKTTAEAPTSRVHEGGGQAPAVDAASDRVRANVGGGGGGEAMPVGGGGGRGSGRTRA